jgi:LPXTG-site transpeptidase (sortase) family protein
MTAVRESAAQPAAPPPSPSPSPSAPGSYRRRPPVTLGRLVIQTAGTALLILAVTALGFVAWIGLFSHLHYDKAQLNAYDTLRVELANGTAPNGPTIPNKAQPLPIGAPVAVLSIPAIGLRAVVLQGTTGSVLENGPGHLRTTVMPGQAGVSVILGRQTAYGGPFGALPRLAPGDAVKVVTGQTVASYTVIDLRRAGDPLAPPPASGAGRLILVTADGAPLKPSGVLYVDADETSKPQPSVAMSVPPLSPTEDAMGTDQQAWLPIVLWGQLLVLIAFGLSWLWTAWGRWQTWVIAVGCSSSEVSRPVRRRVRIVPA